MKIFKLLSAIYLFCVVFTAPALAANDPDSFNFEGYVKRGESFTHKLPSGLYFRLDPLIDSEGWEVGVGPSKDKTDDVFTSITPPLHGPNAVAISPWQFRGKSNPDADDSYGENYSEKPWIDRKVVFALSKKDMDTAFHSYDCFTPDQADRPECKDVADGLVWRQGKLRFHVIDYKLSNAIPNQKAWFEYIHFSVSGDYHDTFESEE